MTLDTERIPDQATRRTGTVTAFFDGRCPLCAREMRFYRRRVDRGEIVFEDISEGASALVAPDLLRADALKRLHIRDRDGTLLSGGAAFAALWRHTPGLRWLGHLMAWRPMGWVAERLYDGFLVVRPAVQRLLRRRN